MSFHNQNGCSQVDVDRDVTLATLAGIAANPNIYGIVCVSLGCEGCQNDMVVDEIRKRTNKPIKTIVIQQVGGSIRAVEEGTRMAMELRAEADLVEREKADVSELIFGTNCGGSDPSSGLGSNPLIGEVSDWLVERGATSVLCETPRSSAPRRSSPAVPSTRRSPTSCSRRSTTTKSTSTCSAPRCARATRAPATWPAASPPSRRSPSAASTRAATVR